MKDTYKIFKLRDKVKDPPPVPLFSRFFNGEQVLKAKDIKELKKVVEREHKMAQSWLDRELNKLTIQNHKQNERTTSKRNAEGSYATQRRKNQMAD